MSRSGQLRPAKSSLAGEAALESALSLKGRVALITGGARGLGHAIARKFAMAGATGLVVDVDALRSETLPEQFSSFVGDVTDEISLGAAFGEIAARFGGVDIVVANAGVVPPQRPTSALDFAEWDHVMAVNVRGVAATIKHAASAMADGGGSILAMASGSAFRAVPRQMAYATSKHAVLGIVRAAARDLGRYGIRVNALAPGPIATRALVERVDSRAVRGRSNRETMAGMAAKSALGRLATEDEVAQAALFLVSDLASGITGAVLPVDAGRL